MKLRNKKTGKIIDSKEVLTDEFIVDLFSKDFNHFNSELYKIQEEWEDVKEPLIKDEGIKKIVLVCADKYETDAYRIASDSAKIQILGYVDMQYLAFSLELYNTQMVDCDNKKLYTIIELCGRKNEQRTKF